MSELDPHGTPPRLAPYRTWPGSLVLFTLIVAYVDSTADSSLGGTSVPWPFLPFRRNPAG